MVFLVAPVLSTLLLVALGILRPVVESYHALLRKDTNAVERWLRFFVCGATLAVPLWSLPVLPLRNEIVLALLLILGHSDAEGAQTVYIDLLAPMIQEVLAQVRTVRLPRAESAEVPMEATPLQEEEEVHSEGTSSDHD
jgi:hypothetical protein